MNPSAIFLDLDGVLADFPTPAVNLFGRPELLEPGRWPSDVYYVKDLLDVPGPVFWKAIADAGPDFWANLPLYSWTYKLVRHCTAIGPTFFLTDPTFCVHCETGKRLWIQKHFGTVIPYVMTDQKHLLARPGRVLIDDYAGNCELWRKHGGQTIEFPGPWTPAECLVSNCPYETCVARLKRLLEA